MAQNKVFRGVHTTLFTDSQGWQNGIYRGTAVVKWNNDKVILNSGGWKTNTTKTRMNQASNQFKLGYYVYQENYEWYVTLPSGEVVDFEDNMEFNMLPVSERYFQNSATYRQSVFA